MTLTDPTGLAGYAAILADPACATTRLQFADFLDEQEQQETCPGCKGSKRDDWGRGSGLGQCHRCNGTGLDTSHAARAEYIRVQIELSSKELEERHHHGCGFHPDPRCPRCQYGLLLLRESALREAHGAEWLQARKCPKCWPEPGSGKGHYNVSPDCKACHGSGDVGGLLRTFTYVDQVVVGNRPVTNTTIGEPVRVEFTNGFPGTVTVPLLSDVVQDVMGTATVTIGEVATSSIEVPTGRHEPTPWAVAVCRHHPVARFVCLNQEPGGGPFVPRDDLPGTDNNWRYWEEGHNCPLALIEKMEGGHRRCRGPISHPVNQQVFYPTRQAAVDALALAVGQFVRGFTQKANTP